MKAAKMRNSKTRQGNVIHADLPQLKSESMAEEGSLAAVPQSRQVVGDALVGHAYADPARRRKRSDHDGGTKLHLREGE